MTSSETLLTKPLASYAHCRRVGSLLFIAGQGCRNPTTNIWAGVTFDAIGELLSIDFEAQVKGVFSNLEDVLKSQGLTKHDLVDVQVFLTNMTEQFPVMNEVWNTFFENVNPLPTRTTIAVAGLPGHNLIEMKAWAQFPS